MEREALRARAAARRASTEVETKTEVTWNCEHCGKRFVQEKAFMNHQCKEMKRAEELKSPIGQAAYSYYAEWMRKAGRSVPPIETFAHSNLYTTFIKFAEFAKKVNLPSSTRYIMVMLEHKLSPGLWCRDTTYELYLHGMNEAYPPADQFFDTYDVIKVLAADYGCEKKEVFDQLGPKKVLDLIQRKKISSWYLLASRNFSPWLRKQPTTWQTAIKDTIGGDALARQAKQHQVVFEQLRKAAEDEDL